MNQIVFEGAVTGWQLLGLLGVPTFIVAVVMYAAGRTDGRTERWGSDRHRAAIRLACEADEFMLIASNSNLVHWQPRPLELAWRHYCEMYGLDTETPHGREARRALL